MEKVIIFGEGNIQEVANFYLQRDERYEVVGFTADSAFIKNDIYLNMPIVPFEEVENIYSPKEYKMFIPLGYKENNHLRARKYYQAKEKGYSFITYISPKATYYGTAIGENCFIFENNVIQPFTKIGNNTIMWSGNHLGHHSIIGNHCFIASHVVISGCSMIDDYTFVGVNATFRNGIHVAKNNLIGAGAIIMEDTAEGEVYVPAKSILLKKKSCEVHIDI